MHIPKKKIAVVFGTRPDTIKLAPVITALREQEKYFTVRLIATAQHRSMLDDVLSAFSIVPDYDLNVMQHRQSLSQLMQHLTEKLDYVFAVEQPDMVIVQGDTATTFVAGLAAFHQKIPVVHVEAGLRTGKKLDPFPEEIYRRLTTQIADLHCTPTATASAALRREGVPRASVLCTGNTVIDAVQRMRTPGHHFTVPQIRDMIREGHRLIVVTAHRRENWGAPMGEICDAVSSLAKQHPAVRFVFPVHLNPAVREMVFSRLSGIPNVVLTEPLNYPDFINLIAAAYAVVTDSGGLQEEAPSFGKPVLVLRAVTERPEAVRSGTVRLVGTKKGAIIAAVNILLSDKKKYRAMAKAVNPYGDGKASERIVQGVMRYFGFSRKKVKEFHPAKK